MLKDETVQASLNEQQIMMLRLFKNPLPEDDFIQMRRLAVQLLAKHLDEEIDNWEIKNGVAEEDYEALSKAHFHTPSKLS